jgi:hypothetical protein
MREQPTPVHDGVLPVQPAFLLADPFAAEAVAIDLNGAVANPNLAELLTGENLVHSRALTWVSIHSSASG